MLREVSLRTIGGESSTVDENLLRDLLTDRPGWRPADWANFLRIKADLSQELTPVQAATYRAAAERIASGL